MGPRTRPTVDHGQRCIVRGQGRSWPAQSKDEADENRGRRALGRGRRRIVGAAKNQSDGGSWPRPQPLALHLSFGLAASLKGRNRNEDQVLSETKHPRPHPPPSAIWSHPPPHRQHGTDDKDGDPTVHPGPRPPSYAFGFVVGSVAGLTGSNADTATWQIVADEHEETIHCRPRRPPSAIWSCHGREWHHRQLRC